MKEGEQGFLALKLNFTCNKTKLVKWFSRYFLYYGKVLINYKQLVPQNTFYAVRIPLNMIYLQLLYVRTDLYVVFYYVYSIGICVIQEILKKEDF